jgi:hypothetical protein
MHTVHHNEYRSLSLMMSNKKDTKKDRDDSKTKLCNWC